MGVRLTEMMKTAWEREDCALWSVACWTRRALPSAKSVNSASADGGVATERPSTSGWPAFSTRASGFGFSDGFSRSRICSL